MSEKEEKAVARGGDGAVPFGRCFSGLERALEAGPLRELDSEKLKNEIKRWAKAVVAYARQLSGNFTGAQERSSEDS